MTEVDSFFALITVKYIMADIQASGGQAGGSVSGAVAQPIRSLIPARLDRLRWSPFH